MLHRYVDMLRQLSHFGVTLTTLWTRHVRQCINECDFVRPVCLETGQHYNKFTITIIVNIRLQQLDRYSVNIFTIL